MLGLAGENLDDVRRYLTATLADPSANLSLPLPYLFAVVPEKIITRAINQRLDRESRVVIAAKRIAASIATPGVGTMLQSLGQDAQYAVRVRRLTQCLSTATVQRPCLDLDDKDKTVILNQFQLYRDDPDSKRATARWQRFLCLFILKNGDTPITPAPAYAAAAERPDANAVIKGLFGTYLPTYPEFLIEAAQEVELFYRRAALNPNAPTRATSTPAVPRPPLFASGAHWITADELSHSALFSTKPSATALLIGTHKDTGQHVYYPHNESLVTIAPTGTSKTQAHVIPNLLTYAGSAFVLDVKGELWDKTAGYRARHFGPVYRFAPTDPSGRTHTYNPFDFIPTDATQAANSCQLLAHQLVPPGDKRNDYWLGRARDFLYAFAMLVVFRHPRNERNLATLANYLALPTSFANGIADPAYKSSQTATVIANLKELAKSINMPDLAHNATAFENALSDTERLESIIDTARQHIGMFSRSAVLRQAMASSSWAPKDLRFRTGTTVYISLNPGDLKAFAPIIRILFQQHADILTQNFKPKPDHLPITFFLDELPQLGYLASLNDLLDLGRGAGIRLWLFAQYFGQFAKTYDKLAQGLIGNCRVTCWMQPDSEAAKILIPNLGTTNHHFSGKSSPLIEAYQLAGREYANDIFVIARGEHPMRLDKIEAYRAYPDRMAVPPPTLPPLPSATRQPQIKGAKP